MFPITPLRHVRFSCAKGNASLGSIDTDCWETCMPVIETWPKITRNHIGIQKKKSQGWESLASSCVGLSYRFHDDLLILNEPSGVSAATCVLLFSSNCRPTSDSMAENRPRIHNPASLAWESNVLLFTKLVADRIWLSGVDQRCVYVYLSLIHI